MKREFLFSVAVVVTFVCSLARAQNMEGSAFNHFAAAVDIKVSSQGIGFDTAMPVWKRLNVRGGANFFQYGATFFEDGVTYVGNLQLHNADASVDFYPFRNAFRVSGGMQFYNTNQITARANVPGGQEIDLDGTALYSSVAGPVNGSGLSKLGHTVAPLVTVGWGNILRPEFASHWSVPVELGFVYIGQPTVNLQLSGITCLRQADAMTPIPGPTCSNIAGNPLTQAQIVGEQTRLSSDLRYLRFYPILSVGFGYRF